MKNNIRFILAIVALISTFASTADVAARELTEFEMKRICFSSPLNMFEDQGDQNYLDDKIRKMKRAFDLMKSGEVVVAASGQSNPFYKKTHYFDSDGTYHFDNPAITTNGYMHYAKAGNTWFGPVTMKSSGTVRVTPH